MNTHSSYSIIGPYGNADECAKFEIDSVENPFILAGITVAEYSYTFSMWLKSDAEGSLTVAGVTFHSSSEWTKYEINFTASGGDLSFIFNSVGVYYLYHTQLEFGTKATSWTPSPDDIDQDVNDIRVATETLNNSVSALLIDSRSITASVEEFKQSTQTALDSIDASLTAIDKAATEVAVTANGLSVRIDSVIQNGVEKVVTKGKQYTLDDDGLTVKQTGAGEMSTKITEDGMEVSKSDEVMLTANSNGVDAKNLHATTYLIVGSGTASSRFEKYGTDRIGCFWIGE